jgi:hypothetical protein
MMMQGWLLLLSPLHVTRVPACRCAGECQQRLYWLPQQCICSVDVSHNTVPLLHLQIKNARTQLAQRLREIRARVRIIISGKRAAQHSN